MRWSAAQAAYNGVHAKVSDEKQVRTEGLGYPNSRTELRTERKH
jgi:hypothetical protein